MPKMKYWALYGQNHVLYFMVTTKNLKYRVDYGYIIIMVDLIYQVLFSYVIIQPYGHFWPSGSALRS